MKFIAKNYNKSKETIHNFMWQSLKIFGTQGVTFLIFIIAAKLLNQYEFGVYNYILAIVLFLTIFGDFGISKATTKYVAEYNAIDKEKLRAVLFNSGIIILGFTIFVAIALLIFGKLYLKENYIYAVYLLPLLFLAPIASLYDGIYGGLKRFKQLAAISAISGILAVSFSYILVLNYGLIGALIAQILFYSVLVFLLALGYREFHLKINKSVIIEIGKYSLFFGLANLGYFLYTRVDIMVLGYFGYIKEIGYYEIVNKVFMLLLLPVTILGTVVAPNSTKDFVLGKFEHIKKKMISESLLLGCIGLLIALCGFFVFPLIFKAFLQEYDSLLLIKLLNILLVLIPLRFFSSYISMAYIAPLGYIKIITKYLIIFGVINLILNLILINIIGFIGVIYATLISQILFIIFKDFISFIPTVFKKIQSYPNSK